MELGGGEFGGLGDAATGGELGGGKGARNTSAAEGRDGCGAGCTAGVGLSNATNGGDTGGTAGSEGGEGAKGSKEAGLGGAGAGRLGDWARGAGAIDGGGLINVAVGGGGGAGGGGVTGIWNGGTGCAELITGTAGATGGAGGGGATGTAAWTICPPGGTSKAPHLAQLVAAVRLQIQQFGQHIISGTGT